MAMSAHANPKRDIAKGGATDRFNDQLLDRRIRRPLRLGILQISFQQRDPILVESKEQLVIEAIEGFIEAHSSV